MTLHEFIAAHRDAIVDACLDDLRADGDDHALRTAIAASLDEIVDGLRRDGQRDDVRATLEHRDAWRPAERDRSGAARLRRALQRHLRRGGEARLHLHGERVQDAQSRRRSGDRVGHRRGVARDRRANEDESSVRIGALAHELRNALSSVSLAYDAIASGRVQAQGEVSAVLGRGIRRMRGLVERTLSALRSPAATEAERGRVVVVDSLRDVVTIAIAERGVLVRVFAGDQLAIDGDSELLASAIGNLLHNALKFTRDAGTVTVRARGERDRVLIEVEDQCGGFPPGKVEDLFTPFVRADAYPGGFGLGLSIVQEAMRLHGGTVTARDVVGAGCVFRLDLPRVP